VTEHNAAYEPGDRVRILATGSPASVLLREDRPSYEPLRQSGDLYWLVLENNTVAAYLYATYQFEPFPESGEAR
jgi:hypothetical protein